ncbi:hypothetical protein LRH25_06675 [Ideonella azotifigens]|uniref:DUF4124 domain-containing protein n=1 Tax=Ideonella azotifigens TaxID=513160 RepID=A0ABN1JP58_9BURK|nr:hypothetical protein [Ideonella azotifigens]MCD2340024.1 hypothetical protein [Ideonella azotifigens]
MRLARRIAALALLAGLVPGASAWAGGEPGRVQVCRVGAVELIVGGQAAGQDCQPGDQRRKLQASPATTGETGIPTGVQKVRDQERRRILEEELAREQAAMSDLQKQGATADPGSLARTQSNLVALRQELARSSTP